MKSELWKLYGKIWNLMVREEGQDLIEYALVVAMIGLAATAAMQTLAVDINAALPTSAARSVLPRPELASAR